jgi:hypothetical protein
MLRDLWCVENGLPWVMELTFRDDEDRVRTNHSPEDFPTFKHMAANLARRAPGRDSIRLRLRTAAWDHTCLASLTPSSALMRCRS